MVEWEPVDLSPPDRVERLYQVVEFECPCCESKGEAIH